MISDSSSFSESVSEVASVSEPGGIADLLPQLEIVILRLCAEIGAGKTICPTEAAKAMAQETGGGELAWRDWLVKVRRSAIDPSGATRHLSQGQTGRSGRFSWRLSPRIAAKRVKHLSIQLKCEDYFYPRTSLIWDLAFLIHLNKIISH